MSNPEKSITARFVEMVDLDDRPKLDGIWIEKALAFAVEPLLESRAELLAAAKIGRKYVQSFLAEMGHGHSRDLEIIDAAIAHAEEAAL